MGPYSVCDVSWLSKFPLNPLAVGQYVNNHNKGTVYHPQVSVT